MNLTRISDENALEIFNVTYELMDNLSGGFNKPDLWHRAEKILTACLQTLASGSDNIDIVNELQKRFNALTGLDF